MEPGERHGAEHREALFAEQRKVPVAFVLLGDSEISGWRINVETFKGAVQLSGFANSLAERRKAVTLARGVKGVKSVQDDIIVP